jgi:Brp/Blh family beta-carotene 15,15'-monooxygenase
MISGLHFGASDIKHIDEIGSKRWLPLMAHGGLVPIAIPGFQPEAVLPIFTILVGEPSSAILLRTIDSLFLIYIAVVIAYLLFSSKYNKWRSSAANLVALLVLAYWLPPLISFAIYFCLWHSRSHYARIWRSIALSDRPRCITETIVYSICAWFVAVGFYWYFQMTLNQGLIEITFIGLAALTVPHMLLVDLADSNSNRFKL